MLKRRESPNCNLAGMTRKLADAQGDIDDMVAGLHRDTVGLYDCIRCGVDGALVEISRCLKRAFDRKVRSLQQSVRDAVRDAAAETFELFASTPVTHENCLKLLLVEPLVQVSRLGRGIFVAHCE